MGTLVKRMCNKGISLIVAMRQTGIGYKLVLKDIRHIPDLHLNLIQFEARWCGCNINFDGGKLRSSGGALVIAKGSTCNTFYKLHKKIVWEEVNVADLNSYSKLSYKQLGHISYKYINSCPKRVSAKLEEHSVWFMHRLFGRKAYHSHIHQEYHTIEKDSCIAIGLHWCIYCGCTITRWRSIFCVIHRWLLEDARGICD